MVQGNIPTGGSPDDSGTEDELQFPLASVVDTLGDADGTVAVALEAERSNNDTLRAVPEDYDKMTARDPEAAIWIVKNRDAARDVLDALNDPPEGPTRIEKEYSRSSPPQRFNIDEPGFTEIHTFQYLRDSIIT